MKSTTQRIEILKEKLAASSILDPYYKFNELQLIRLQESGNKLFSFSIHIGSKVTQLEMTLKDKPEAQTMASDISSLLNTEVTLD